LQRKTKRGPNSKQEEEGMYHERTDDHGRTGYSISVTKTHRHHSPPHSLRKFYASEDSINKSIGVSC
jgi:hypothetical protein